MQILVKLNQSILVWSLADLSMSSVLTTFNLSIAETKFIRSFHFSSIFGSSLERLHNRSLLWKRFTSSSLFSWANPVYNRSAALPYCKNLNCVTESYVELMVVSKKHIVEWKIFDNWAFINACIESTRSFLKSTYQWSHDKYNRFIQSKWSLWWILVANDHKKSQFCHRLPLTCQQIIFDALDATWNRTGMNKHIFICIFNCHRDN